jgi:hypothetical protein
MALIAAGLAKNGAQLWMKPVDATGDFERAAQILQGMWDGARVSEGGSCSFAGLDPGELAKVRQNLPRLHRWLGTLKQKAETEAADAEARARDAGADAQLAGNNRKAVEGLRQEAVRAVAGCGFPNCAQHPEVGKRIAVLDQDGEFWNQAVVERERQRVQAAETAAEKTKEAGTVGALEAEVGRAIN